MDIGLLASSLCGFVSSAFWFRSATLRGKTLKGATIPYNLPDGDLAFGYEGDHGPEVLHWRIALQNKYNAWGATFAAIALLIQSVVSIVRSLQ
ncbi:MAG: hypothetical protein ACK4Y9_04685 [Hyphomonas sp.]